MVEESRGDFLPVAKAILVSGKIQKGLWVLAKHGELSISMESVVQQDPWRADFTVDELAVARWRIQEVQRRVDHNELPDDED